MRIAPGFIAARNSAPTSPRVASVSGQCSETKSAIGSASASGVRTWPARAGAPGTAAFTTRIPNASPMRATAPPIAPAPTTTSVLPAISMSGCRKKQKSDEAAQTPTFTAALCPATSCEKCRMSANTSSATDSVA